MIATADSSPGSPTGRSPPGCWSPRSAQSPATAPRSRPDSPSPAQTRTRARTPAGRPHRPAGHCGQAPEGPAPSTPPPGTPRLPRRDRRPDRRRQHRRGGIPADRDPPPPRRLIRQRATAEPGHPGQRIGDPLDQPQRRRRRPQRRGQERRQQRGRNLMPHIRQETGQANTAHPAAKPPGAVPIVPVTHTPPHLEPWPGSDDMPRHRRI